MYKKLSICLLFLLSMFAYGEEHIEANKAPFYVGKNVMACGILAQVTHLNKVHYLNFDQPYPKQSLTIVIWADDYPNFTYRFGQLDVLQGQRFCARGRITEYKDFLQIVVKNPQFLRLMR